LYIVTIDNVIVVGFFVDIYIANYFNIITFVVKVVDEVSLYIDENSKILYKIEF